MSTATVLRSIAASVCVWAASLYFIAFNLSILLKGLAGQPEIPLAAYLGLGVAAIVGFAAGLLAGRPREAIPSVIAVALIGVLAQPLMWSISYSLRHRLWLL